MGSSATEPYSSKTPPGEPDGVEERLFEESGKRLRNQPNLPDVEAIRKAAYVRM